MGNILKSHLIKGEELSLRKLLFTHEELHINASLTFYKNRYWFAYRTSDLDEFDARNYLTELDESFEPLNHRRLIPENNNFAFEDIRLFTFEDQLLAIYSYLPKIEGRYEWVFALGIGVVNVESGLIYNQQSLREFSKRTHEKNWAPLINKGTLYLITDVDPFLRILKLTGRPGSFDLISDTICDSKTKGWEFGELRGGTPFIQKPGDSSGWSYAFIHSSLSVPNGNIYSKIYYYTLYRINIETKITQYVQLPLGYSTNFNDSSYITLWAKGTYNRAHKVVFPMGLINYEDGVLLSFGKDDCISLIKFYSWGNLTSLF